MPDITSSLEPGDSRFVVVTIPAGDGPGSEEWGHKILVSPELLQRQNARRFNTADEQGDGLERSA